jgi:hypothetical protein
MRARHWLTCAAIIVGCNTAREHPRSAESAADAAVPLLCDGSDDFRLLINDALSGASLGLHPFEYPHNGYLVVDGHCHYIALWNYMLGIRQGDLSDGELSSLENDLALARLASLRSTRSPCNDSGTLLLATPDANVSARCPEFEPNETDRVLSNAAHWEVRLAKAGMPLDGQVTARALRGEPPNHGEQTAAVAPWPLARKLSQIPSLLSDDSDFRHPVGAQFEGEEARVLRDLRTSFATMYIIDDVGQGAAYVEEDGVTYTLTIRDDLPDDLDQRLSDFIEQCWSQAPLPP